MFDSQKTHCRDIECSRLDNDCVSGATDSKLLLAARRGNQFAFGELCQRYSVRVFRVVVRISRNREDAEDALQEATLKAFVHLKDFDGRSSFSTWFTRIAINSALMILRRNSARRSHSVNMDDESIGNGFLEIPDSSPNPEAALATEQEYVLLRRAVSKIRRSLQPAIELRYHQERSLAETALALGVTVGAVKARLFHAKAQLRKAVARERQPNTAMALKQAAKSYVMAVADNKEDSEEMAMPSL